MNASAASAGTRISVVIPVLNAGRLLPGLLQALFSQKPEPPTEVVLVDSMSTDDTRRIAASDPRVRVVPIAEFTHGRARNVGVREAHGDVVVVLSQDALPANDSWLERLVEPLADSSVGAVYSRQAPRPDAPPTERFFLEYHFPAGPAVRRERRGTGPLALRDVFFSNVSAAFRRATAMEHPFDEDLIMSEDQKFSLDLITAGLAVVYQPDSIVIHSHNYSLGTAFRRYFDSVYSLRLIFSGHDMAESASMGARYIWREALHILRHHPLYMPRYCMYVLAKTGGTICAHFAERMPRSLARRCSLHRYHWDRPPRQ